MKRLTLLFALVALTNTVMCQETSNKGTLFWVGFMDHIDGTGADMDLYITSDSSTTGTVSIPGQAWSVNFSVTADSMTLISVPSNKAHMSCSDCIEDKGIKITAVKPIVAYAHIHHSARSDATLVLPAESTGQEYFVMSYSQESSGQKSQFMVIASQDNTKIRITPTDNVSARAANTSYEIILDAGEVYQGQAPNRLDDLTGTKIEVIDTGASANCRKVSVFSGSSFTSIGCGFGSGDNLYQQLYPTSSWSNTFATVPFKSRSFDRFRILASKDNTVVLIDGKYITTLNSGQFYETGNVSKPQYIFGNKPISVAQFQVTQSCGGTGDPSMTILSPVQQTLEDITVYSSQYENIKSNYINVVMPTNDTSTFTIDNKKVKFSIISSLPSYAYAQIDVLSGNHHLKADEGFVAIAYGFGTVESYGYSAGANVTNLSQYIQLDDPKVSNINTICLGETAKFKGNANFAVAKWEWSFGDDSISSIQNPSHIYSDTGEYKVKMYTTKPSFDGCSFKDSAEIMIKVVNYPAVSFGFDNACFGDTVNFLDTVTTDAPGALAFTLWDYGDGKKEFANNPSHLYDTAGRYGVELVAKNSFECFTRIKDTIEIYPIPIAKFFASNPCFKDSIKLQDSSYTFPHSITDWVWNMGEGSIDTTYTDKHTFLYDTSGSFTIALTIKTDKGCIATTDSLFTKHAQFIAAFSSRDECLKNSVNIQDTSNTSGVMPVSRLWHFGDGTTSIDKNTLHSYNLDGDYTIKLIIRQNSECMDSIEKPITIHKQVMPSFNIQNLCHKDSSILTANHSPALEVVNNYEWKINGNTYLGQKWTHQFSDSGKNNFSLITTTSNGCLDTLDTFAMINPKPFADFTSKTACENVEIELINSSRAFGANLTKLEWSSNTASSIGNPDTFSYLLNSPAFESVQLIVESADACKDTVIRSIKVWTSPHISIGIGDICNTESIDATNTTTVDSSKIASWFWSLDDGILSSDSIPSATYTVWGTKKAILTAISDKGCIGKDSVQFKVNPLPVTSYTITEACLGSATQFSNTSTINAGSIVQTLYSFGDGNSSSQANPNHNYLADGNYNSKLVAISNFGCKDSLSKSLKVHALPVADLSALPLKGCPPLNVTFTDLSSVNNDVLSEWEWSDSKGTFATTQSANNVFFTSGNKDVSLKVKSTFGCEHDVSYANLIEVYPKPIANFSYLPIKPTIIESTVTFTNLSVESNAWNWGFGDGASTTEESPIHTYSDTGLYNVRLEVSNTDNCENDTTIKLFVEPAFSVHIANSFSPNGDGLNDAWGPEGVLHGVKGYELLIFNRWGEILFQTDNLNIKWDGTYKGVAVPEGFYSYRMRYADYFFTQWYVQNKSVYLMR